MVSTSLDQLLTELQTHLIHHKNLRWLVTPNPEQIIQAQESPTLQQSLLEADWVLPDGVGLWWASRLLASRGTQGALVEVLPGRQVVAALVKRARSYHWKCVLIGGQGYAGQRTTAVLDVQGTSVEWMQGYQQIANPTQLEEQAVAQTLLAVRPDIVFVAFGAPYQEKWLLDHRSLLEKAGVKLAMAVGGSFDTLLGKVPTPPLFITKLGFEWLFRLLIQPSRWRRQLRLVRFILLVAQTWLNPELASRLPQKVHE